MNKKDLFHFGYFLKTSGFNGHLLIAMDVDEPARYRELSAIYIEAGEGNYELTPLSFYELNRNGTCTVQLPGTDSFEKAQAFLKKNVYLPLSLLPPLDERSFYFHEVPGFLVLDKSGKEIGTAEAVVSSPGQDILQVKNGRTEILIPLKKEFILSVDRAKKILHLDPPEGLVEMYLGKHDEEEE